MSDDLEANSQRIANLEARVEELTARLSQSFKLSQPMGWYSGYIDIDIWAKDAGVTDARKIKRLKDMADTYWRNGYAASTDDLRRFLNVPDADYVEQIVYGPLHKD